MAFDNLKQLYINSIEHFADNACFSLFESDESLTYLDIDQKVSIVREYLLDAGLVGGDKVAILSNNMPNWCVCYFAVVTSGMVAVPILPDFSSAELERILEHCEAKALVVSDKLFAKVPQQVTRKMNVVIRSKNLSVISGQSVDRGNVGEPQSSDVAAIIYTSGTTSAPKGVMLTHANLCRQVELVTTIQRVGVDDIFLSILPLSHAYECSIGMLLPFCYGASVVYLDRPPTASALMPALKGVRPTMMLSVPLIIEKIYKSQIVNRFASNAFSRSIYEFMPVRKVIHFIAGRTLRKVFGGRLHFFGIGGAKLDPSVERFLKESHFPYAIGYGLTETSPLIAGANPQQVRWQSTGPAMKDIRVRLDDIDPATGEGEIVINGPCTMLGYYKEPEATKAVFTSDGWFRTKDLACLDKDGYIYIKGRLNNMIVGPSGENIYPEEIESVINGHLLVADSIVKQDKGRLVALVQFDGEAIERKYHNLKDGLGYRMEEIKSELIHYVNSKVSKFSHISIVEEQNQGFEKTPTHKIKRFLYTPKTGIK